MWQPEFSTPNALPPDSSWAAWPLQAIGAVIADQKFNIRLHRLTCTRFDAITILIHPEGNGSRALVPQEG